MSLCERSQTGAAIHQKSASNLSRLSSIATETSSAAPQNHRTTGSDRNPTRFAIAGGCLVLVLIENAAEVGCACALISPAARILGGISLGTSVIPLSTDSVRTILRRRMDMHLARTHHRSPRGDHRPDQASSAMNRRLAHEQLEDRRLLTTAVDANPHDLSVMSRNLYIGGNLAEIVAAAQIDPQTIPLAVGNVWADVQEREFPSRAEAFADEIAEAQPAIIGLQEVSQFSVLKTGVETGETVDYLQILMVELAERDLNYEAVVTTYDFGGIFPALIGMELQYIQYVDRDVMLVRTDLPAEALSVSNPQSGNFQAYVPLDLGLEEPIPLCAAGIRSMCRCGAWMCGSSTRI